MSIPISITKLLTDNVVEWARIEFKESWNPDSTLKTISAFANDADNWGGGYIVIGAKEDSGKLVRPVKGIDTGAVDAIQKELLQYCKYLRPAYIPQSEPVRFDGKTLLLIWCPGGYERPYACPKVPSSKSSEKIYYIRKLSSTIEASATDVKELMSLSNNIPFDDRINPKAEIKDLKFPLLQNYLQAVGSNLLPNLNDYSIESIAENLRIADGPKEYFKPLNVGLLFFNDTPEKFFPYSRIEVVNIPDPTGQGMEERIFSGPIDEQLRSALAYIKNYVIAEKVFKLDNQAESVRVFNYSYEALEEFISNAIYHKSYQMYEPVTIRIEPDKIEITSVPGPDRSITDNDLKNLQMRTRRYRNRRIGDFLKELHLVEGRNTGIPTALKKIRENGSPPPTFLTDDERSFFSVIVPINSVFLDAPKVEETIQKKERITRRRSSKAKLKEEICRTLSEESMSTVSLYRRLGYSGSTSKTFRLAIDELISENIIKYSNSSRGASNNVLILCSRGQ